MINKLIFSSLLLALFISHTNSITETVPYWTTIIEKPFPLINPAVITNPVITANDVTDGAWFVADPFLFYEDGQWYMFFEALIKGKGRGAIALAKSTDGLHWTYDSIVLENPWHNSYPFIMKYNDKYYMIPESYQQNSVIVYEAADFPYGWGPVATIASGRAFVDPSIFRYDGTWWMFVGDANIGNCYLYYSDDLLTGWKEHPKSPIVLNDASKSRPGGRSFVYDNGKILRISQKGDVTYGEQVRVFEVDTLTKTDYAEHEIPESPVLKAGLGWNENGMHHCDCWWNNNKWLCAVDGKDSNNLWSIGIYFSSEPGTEVYLSDLNWLSATNGWGPVERDKSNGEQVSGDGKTITLNGITYSKGLGVHANSEVTYVLNGQYSTFLSDIGVDDEVGSNGSVAFQVWGDGIKLYDSGVMTGSSSTKLVNIDISGVNVLKLVVTNGGDNINYDHADWANARLIY